jgi:chromosome segregation ATPase
MSRMRVGGGLPAEKGLSEGLPRTSRAAGVDPICTQGLGSSGRESAEMSKLEAATARLAAALDALAKAAAPLAENRRKLGELTSERETLLARISELEEESRSLASTNEEIETRLDSAIGEIRTALGR